MKSLASTATGRSRLVQQLLDWSELCKPRLSALVLVTVAAGYALATVSGVAFMPDTMALIGALLGVSLTAAGGATLNQVLERHLDARMERTKLRPIAAGRISPWAATLFGIAAAVAGWLVLDGVVHRLAAVLALISVVNYVVIYTPLKRVTTFNTLVGAITGALPPVIGWTAATGALEPQAWALFAVLFVWQLPHFLAVAWLYRDDYAKGGMKMLSVADPNGRVTMRQILLFSLTMLPASLLPAVAGLAGLPYAVTALVLGGAILVLALQLVRLRTQDAARRLFLGSVIYLPLLLIVLIVDSATGGGRWGAG